MNRNKNGYWTTGRATTERQAIEMVRAELLTRENKLDWKVMVCPWNMRVSAQVTMTGCAIPHRITVTFEERGDYSLKEWPVSLNLFPFDTDTYATSRPPQKG